MTLKQLLPLTSKLKFYSNFCMFFLIFDLQDIQQMYILDTAVSWFDVIWVHKSAIPLLV